MTPLPIAACAPPSATHEDCARCGAFQGCSEAFREARGSNLLNPEVLFVSEAPGSDAAERVLRDLIEAVGLKDYAVTDAVRCRPSGKLDTAKINHCHGHLLAEILRMRPKLIVLLGNTPLQSVLGIKGITKARGAVTFWDHPQDPNYRVNVLPMFHPASTLYKDGAGKFYLLSQDMESIPGTLGNIDNPEDATAQRELCMDREHVEAVLADCDAAEKVAFDTETGGIGTGGLNPWAGNKILGLSLAWAHDACAFIPIDHPESPFKGEDRVWLGKRLREFFLKRKRLRAHNGKFDIEHMVVELFDSDEAMADALIEFFEMDTMIALAALDEEQPKGLKDATRKMTSMGNYEAGLDKYIREHPEIDRKANGFYYIPLNELWTYAADDARATWRIGEVCDKRLRETILTTIDGAQKSLADFFYEHFMRVLHATIRLRLNGAKIDQDQVNKNEITFKQEISDSLKELRDDPYVLMTEASFAHQLLEKQPKAKEKFRAWLDYNPLAEKFLQQFSPGGEFDIAYKLIYARRYYQWGDKGDGKEAPWSFAPTKDKRLARLLYDIGGCPVLKRTKGGLPSVDKKTLKELAEHPDTPPAIKKLLVKGKKDDGKTIPGPIAKVKLATKALSTYVIPYRTLVDSNSFLHCNFLCAGGSWKNDAEGGTVTGRLSSEWPNLQNIPHDPRITSQFKSRFEGGFILQGDYAQLELRVLAGISGEDAMKQAFLEDKDLHSFTVTLIYGIPFEKVDKKSYERQFCKTMGFAIVYGMGDDALALQTGSTVEAAKETKEKWFGAFPKIKPFIAGIHTLAATQGYVVNPFGRRRFTRGAQQTSDNKLRSYANRVALNAPIQGAGADICLIAMYRIDAAFRKLKMKSKVILQIHDSITIDVHPSEIEKVMHISKIYMERPYDWMQGVPLKVEWKMGRSWGEFDVDWRGMVGKAASAKMEAAQAAVEEDIEVKEKLGVIPTEDDDVEEEQPDEPDELILAEAA